MPEFVHLHTHSHYSFLSSLCTTEQLTTAAAKHSMPAIALTDIGNMYGAMEFFLVAKKVGIKPIIAIDFLFFDYDFFAVKNPRFNYETRLPYGMFRFSALAENMTGYRNLCKLSTASFSKIIGGFPTIDFTMLKENHEGIIFLSGGREGLLFQKLLERQNTGKFDKQEPVYKVLESFTRLKNGDSKSPEFFIELQCHKGDKENKVNLQLLEAAKHFGIPLVATSEIYYMEKEDWQSHEVLMCVGARSFMNLDNGFSATTRPCLNGSDYYFRSAEEMHKLFGMHDGALENTLGIAERCNTDIVDSVVHMPNFLPSVDDNAIETPPAEKNINTTTTNTAIKHASRKDIADKDELLASIDGKEGLINGKLEDEKKEFLRLQHLDLIEKTNLGLANLKIGDTKTPLYKNRLHQELQLLEKMGFSGYFLIVSDIIDAAKKRGIMVGPGRGSVVGSLVSFCLGITSVDPLEYDLLFERFLTPDRVSLPDIDIDFQDDMREWVIEYVRKKYGNPQVCQIVTFARLKAKAAFKDVARVFGVEFQLANQLSAMIFSFLPSELVDEKEATGKTMLELSYEHSYAFKSSINNTSELKTVYKHARKIENLARQSGIHAAGVVIADKALDTYIPLAKNEDNITISQYDGRFLEEKCGLLKMDFLGLRTLTILKHAVAEIEKNWGEKIDIDNLAKGDKKTYELFTQGQTMGIFQFESAGMTRYVQELRPSRLEELIAMNALYRPGPMKWIPVYIANKQKKKPKFVDPVDEKKYKQLDKLCAKNPVLEAILKPTMLIPVYQEQIMQISQSFAGFNASEADRLRSAMAKKKKKQIASIRVDFIKRSVALKNEEADAVFLYDDVIEAFGSYGFNKSHSASYAYLAYQVAYLKANYPAEFFAAFLNNEINSLSSIGKFKRIVDECLSFNVAIALPCVNTSGALFQSEKGKIVFGIAAVKGVGVKMAHRIVAERTSSGPYLGVEDFISRHKNNSLFNKQVVENMIKAGCFQNLLKDKFSIEIACDQLIAIFPEAFARAEKEKELMRGGQMSFFEQSLKTKPKQAKENSLNEKLQDELQDDLLLRAKNTVHDPAKAKAYELQALGFSFRYDQSMKYAPLLRSINAILQVSKSTKPLAKKELQKKDNPTANKLVEKAHAIVSSFGKTNDPRSLKFAGIVETVKEVLTRKDNQAMAIVVLSLGCEIQEMTSLEMLCFPKNWEKLKKISIDGEALISTGALLMVECRKMRRQEGKKQTFSLEDCKRINPDQQQVVDKKNTSKNTSKTANKPNLTRDSSSEIKKDLQKPAEPATEKILQNSISPKHLDPIPRLQITIPVAEEMTKLRYGRLKNIFQRHPGRSEVLLVEILDGKSLTFSLGDALLVSQTAQLKAELLALDYVSDVYEVLPVDSSASVESSA